MRAHISIVTRAMTSQPQTRNASKAFFFISELEVDKRLGLTAKEEDKISRHSVNDGPSCAGEPVHVEEIEFATDVLEYLNEHQRQREEEDAEREMRIVSGKRVHERVRHDANLMKAFRPKQQPAIGCELEHQQHAHYQG